MLDKIKKWFLKPYPLVSALKTKVFISFGIGLFVFFFLLIFKPFSFYEMEKTKILYYIELYAFIAFSVSLFCFIVLPKIFNSFYKANEWNIFKNTILVIVVIVVIGITNWIASDYSTFYVKKSKFTLLFFISTAFPIGFFPLIIYTFFIERSIYKKKQKVIDNIGAMQNKYVKVASNFNEKNIIISLYSQNKKEKFTLDIASLLFISSEKNYVSIFYLEKDVIKEKLLRSSLSNIENQLEKYNSIVRCHKSYIVHTNHVENIFGNARNYTLKIANTNILIPVSRKFPKELLFTLVK